MRCYAQRRQNLSVCLKRVRRTSSSSPKSVMGSHNTWRHRTTSSVGGQARRCDVPQRIVPPPTWSSSVRGRGDEGGRGERVRVSVPRRCLGHSCPSRLRFSGRCCRCGWVDSAGGDPRLPFASPDPAATRFRGRAGT
jgi:hypothetical protein